MQESMGREYLVELSDGELVERLDAMVRAERKLGVAIVLHLKEVEQRQLHLALGYSLLYAYARERLGFSEAVAYKRVSAARAMAKRPEIAKHLESGELTLSSVGVLAPHVEREDGAELIEEARGKSRREVERLVV